MIERLVGGKVADSQCHGITWSRPARQSMEQLPTMQLWHGIN